MSVDNVYAYLNIAGRGQNKKILDNPIVDSAKTALLGNLKGDGDGKNELIDGEEDSPKLKEVQRIKKEALEAKVKEYEEKHLAKRKRELDYERRKGANMIGPKGAEALSHIELKEGVRLNLIDNKIGAAGAEAIAKHMDLKDGEQLNLTKVGASVGEISTISDEKTKELLEKYEKLELKGGMGPIPGDIAETLRKPETVNLELPEDLNISEAILVRPDVSPYISEAVTFAKFAYKWDERPQWKRDEWVIAFSEMAELKKKLHEAQSDRKHERLRRKVVSAFNKLTKIAYKKRKPIKYLLKSD